MSTPYVKRYSFKEELFNSISHGVGALFSIIATVVMVYFSIKAEDNLYLLVSIIYGASLIVLYTMSTLYHAFTNPRVKEIFRTFDHCSIFLLIAGSYTPYTMITLRDGIGFPLSVCIWGAAVIGITLNIISIERFKVFSMICYVAMGWTAVFTIKPMYQTLEIGGLALLVLGGLCYTGGLVFYGKGRTKPYMHFVWHLFVLMGSICHFGVVMGYVMV